MKSKSTSELLKSFFDKLSPEQLTDLVIPSTNSIFGREWFCGTKDPAQSPERVRKQESSRFALAERKVCYFAVDCARIDVEIGDFFSDIKKTGQEIDFARDTWPRMTGQVKTDETIQHILGAFKLGSDPKILNLGNDGKIRDLNELWNGFNEEAAQADFITRLIEGPRPDVYAPSGLFAEAVYNKQFDGILYRPTTIIQNILGPCNDPMLVLFSPASEKTLANRFHG